MRFVSLITVFMLAALPSAAEDVAASLEICGNKEMPQEERVAACGIVVDKGTEAEKADAYFHRGSILYRQKEYEAALGELDLSLGLVPDKEMPRRYRVLALNAQRSYDRMLEDTTRLTGDFPDESWNFYYHGLAFYRLKRYEEALPAYDRAIELYPDYDLATNARALLHYRLKNYDKAVADSLRTIELDRFWAAPYFRLGEIYEDTQDVSKAAHFYRIASSIDPNFATPRVRLERLVGLDAEVALPPLDYTAPKPGLELRFMQTLLPKEEVSPEDEIIGGLIEWFRPSRKADPKSIAFVKRTVVDVLDDQVVTSLDLEEVDKFGKMFPKGVKFPVEFRNQRGLVRTGWRGGGKNGPEFAIVFDGVNPRDIWPLEPGKELQGTGGIDLVCPEGFSLPAITAGCRPDVRRVRVGSVEFEMQVKTSERIHVPLGSFETYVVRYGEKGRIEMFGKTQEREVISTWWWSPEIGFWIKRLDQIGDELSLHQALELSEGTVPSD